MKKNPQHKINTYLDSLYKLDYKERPVSVETFICDREFLGNVTDCGKSVYPVWIKMLQNIFDEPSKYLIVLTGSIRTGKTKTAIKGLLYLTHRILCLRDPWKFFNLEAGGKLALMFFSLTKSLGASKGFNLFNSYMMESPWFTSRGIIHKSAQSPWLEFPLIDYKIGSPYVKGFGGLGEDIIGGMMDEIDSPNESVGHKQRIIQAYDAAVRRHMSNFVLNGESFGKFFLVSSKQEELSFLNTFVESKKNDPAVFVFDEPIWKVRPRTNYCGTMFEINVGDVYRAPKIIKTTEDKADAVKENFQIVEIPIEYRTDFENDIVGALRDLAGISVHGSRKSKLFTSERLLLDCYDDTKIDPISQPIIVLGLKSDLDLMQFINLSRLRIPKNVPRFLHYDISYSGDGDALSLASSAIKGWTKSNVMKEDGTFETRSVPIIETDFAIRCTAKPGDQVPLFAIRKFILDLRTAGLRIFNLTADLRLLSTDTIQVLSRSGINCDYLSVDKSVDPYLEFRNLVNEKRWVCHKQATLHFELVNLEYNRDLNKIDHPDKVKDVEILQSGEVRDIVVLGSKDVSDAVVGSVFGALTSNKIPMDVEKMREFFSKTSKKAEVREDIARTFTDRVLPKDSTILDKNKAMSDLFKKLR